MLFSVATFIIIYGRYEIQARSFPQDVTGFRNLDFNYQESETIPVRVKDATNNEVKAIQTESDDHNQEKVPYEISTNFVNKFFESDDDQQRQKRSFKTVDENSFLDEDKAYDEESIEDMVRQDDEFQEQQSKASNLTNSSQVLYEEIEDPQSKTETNEVICDNENQGNDEKKQAAFVQRPRDTSMNDRIGSNDFLEMHFYKMLPDTGSLQIIPEDKKSLVINLYGDGSKSKKEIQTPDKYDYLELLSKGSKLVQVPAVRFTVVPSESTNRRRRQDRLTPFYISRNGNYPQRL